MATKHRVLEILEQNRGASISGEHIAAVLDISRNIIWRAIKDLRHDGYVIAAVTNKGYRLDGANDILSAEGIKPFLRPSLSADMQVYSEIDSTSREAKAQAISNAAHGTVILSDCQTDGKGRFGRAFFSPPHTGLYMSFVLQAGIIGFANPTAITAYAALCVCEAIEAACGIQPSIKWVNDILLHGKKIGGILTEAITDFESGGTHEIILGIGLNVSTPPSAFPAAIQAQAGALYPDGNPPVTRNQLAAEIINRLLAPEMPGEAELFARYKQRLCMLGADITVTQGTDTYAAKALDINETGHLIVQTDSGETRTLSSGEISISLTV